MKIIDFDLEKYNGEKIFIYGTGNMAYITTFFLQQNGFNIYMYVNQFGDYHAPFRNVISLDELVTVYNEKTNLILFCENDYARMHAEILNKKGIETVYSVRKLWNEFNLKDYPELDKYYSLYRNKDQIFFFEDTIAYTQKVYLFSLDAVVTERCSLKCKDCSNLMQYYKHPNNLNVDELKVSIDMLLKKVDAVYELRILGGEPFMNTEFVKIIDAYLNEPKIKRIGIFSNATIFPKEEVLEHLKNEKTYIRMSDYGNYSRHIDTWIQWCEENEVYYEVIKMDMWQDCGKLKRHDYCEYELMDIYGNCSCRNLPTVFENKLYNCPYAANAANLGAMYKYEVDKDYLVLDEKITGTEINKFLYERKYLEACRYCNGRNQKRARVVPYRQTNKSLDYELLNEKVYEEKKDFCTSTNLEKKDMPLLSVVIPVYNAEATIERCLQSVLNQKYNNVEILVIDDGSTDRSVEICTQIAQSDERVRFIKNAHSGRVITRNIGIENSNGNYITFVDADDYIAVDRYQNMMSEIDDCDLLNAGYMEQYIIDSSSDICMSRGQAKFKKVADGVWNGIYEGDSLVSYIVQSYQNNIYEDYNPFLWSKIYKTDIMKRIYKYVDVEIDYCEDVVLYHRYLLECKKVKGIKDYGYFYVKNNLERDKYSEESRIDNMLKIMNCEKQFLKNEDRCFTKALETMCGKVIKEAVKYWGGEVGIYYPYYGRLSGKRVILYGAGNVGKSYYKHIKDDEECELVAWVDGNSESIRKQLLPIDDFNCLFEMEYDYIIVAVFDKIIYEQIKISLENQGIEENKILWNPTKYE